MARTTISQALVMIHEAWDFKEWDNKKRLDEVRRVLLICESRRVNLHLLATALRKEMEVDMDWTQDDLQVIGVAFAVHNVPFKRPSFI